MQQEPQIQRKLVAIMAGDMVGFSRLMESDEVGTLARLKAHKLELIDPAIAKNKGRIIKTTGDGMLVEFASSIDAAQCALEVQRGMARRNADVAPERRIEFRMGINIGDVIVEGSDIFGDGVNLAARLEQSAEPGGILVSQVVRDQLANRIDAEFEDAGERAMKNISRPVRCYRLSLRAPALETIKIVPSAPESGPDQPSIAVLPLVNMSGDPEQEFFADGLTEDIITALSRFRDLMVISRNSAFVYKGKAVNVQEVAKAFGVKYVVEGSVRKAGNRVRITVQLIDARTDHHIWAERYDRELSDIFATQDELTATIVATLPGRMEAAAHERVLRNSTKNMRAYECVLAAKVLHHRSRHDDNIEAQRLIDRAIELDPNYAHAHAWKACITGQAWMYNWCADREKAVATIMSELNLALSLDENDSDVHRILAAVNINYNNHETAWYHQQRALTLNPNNDLIVVQNGEILTWMGEPEQGIDWIKQAMRLNPHHPERFWSHLGRAYFLARRYAEAIDAFRRITKPDQFHHAFLAAASAMLGEREAANAQTRLVLSINPSFSVVNYMQTLHYKRPEDAEHHRQALVMSGLPE